ncbi:hypothetical protein Tco_1456889 [Tanacetum coccineum]
MKISHIAQNVKWEDVIQVLSSFLTSAYDFQQAFRSYDCFRDISGKFVRSSCTTVLNVVPWETNGESVLREALERENEAEGFKELDDDIFIKKKGSTARRNPSLQLPNQLLSLPEYNVASENV